MCLDARRKPYFAGFFAFWRAESGLRNCSDMLLLSMYSFRLCLLSETTKGQSLKSMGILKLCEETLKGLPRLLQIRLWEGIDRPAIIKRDHIQAAVDINDRSFLTAPAHTHMLANPEARSAFLGAEL